MRPCPLYLVTTSAAEGGGPDSAGNAGYPFSSWSAGLAYLDESSARALCSRKPSAIQIRVPIAEWPERLTSPGKETNIGALSSYVG